MALILVEGCDGVGKTTLIEQLRERLGSATRVLHRGPPEEHPLIEYEVDLLDYVPGEDHILCDRWHWGELVYAPLYRDGSVLGGWSGAGRRHVELFLKSRGAVMVHLYAEEDLVRRRLEARGEDYLQDKDVARVLRAFQRASGTSILTTLDVRSPHASEAVDRILEEAKARERAAIPLRDTCRYVGDPQPHALLVGEQAIGHPLLQAFERDDLPPFMPFGATSGRYLLDALPGLEWGRIGLVNALDEDVFTVWWRTLKPHTVALGRTAQSTLRELGIPHGVVPHPQFVRRFHYGRKRDYRRSIADAAVTMKDVIEEWRT